MNSIDCSAFVARAGRVGSRSKSTGSAARVPIASALFRRPAVVLAAVVTVGILGWAQPAAAQTGACCDGINCLLLTQADCAQIESAVFLGAGSTCTNNPCLLLGACCTPNGCIRILEADCTAAGGSFAGPGTTCSPTLCVPGACCVGGVCMQLTVFECVAQAGLFGGSGVPCTPDPCTIGACCVETVCMLDSGLACAMLGGQFQGPNTDCAGPNPCSLDGACCLPNGCTLLSQANCLAGGGSSGPAPIATTCPVTDRRPAACPPAHART